MKFPLFLVDVGKKFRNAINTKHAQTFAFLFPASSKNSQLFTCETFHSEKHEKRKLRKCNYEGKQEKFNENHKNLLLIKTNSHKNDLGSHKSVDERKTKQKRCCQVRRDDLR